jgi:hypothetical protein
MIGVSKMAFVFKFYIVYKIEKEDKRCGIHFIIAT